MGWHLDALPLSSCQDVESSVSSVIEVLSAHQCPDSGLFIILCEFLSIWCLVVIQIKQVISSSSLVLLASVEVINLSLENCVLLRLHGLHAFKPIHLSRESIFPSSIVFCLLLSELCLSNFLVCHREIFIKSILL